MRGGDHTCVLYLLQGCRISHFLSLRAQQCPVTGVTHVTLVSKVVQVTYQPCPPYVCFAVKSSLGHAWPRSALQDSCGSAHEAQVMIACQDSMHDVTVAWFTTHPRA